MFNIFLLKLLYFDSQENHKFVFHLNTIHFFIIEKKKYEIVV